MSDNFHHLVVEDSARGQRLDKFLSSRLSDISRSYIQQLLADGCLSRDGKTIESASVKVKPGETYLLRIPEIIPLDLTPVAMDLPIVFEDDQLLVINKPAGLAVHPAPGTKGPTLVHGLLAHCRESLSGIGGVARPGIVHRIDKETSGLLVVAKTDHAHQHLSAQLKDRSLSRTYQAICWGVPNPPSGTIDAPIGRHPVQRKKMAVVPDGKSARTRYIVEESLKIASLLTCKLESGRTHQIRVHLTHIGHGLVGDPVYGQDTNTRLKRLGIVQLEETDCFLKQYRRQALNACMLTLNHPINNTQMTFTVDMPGDMVELLSTLKNLHI